MRFKKKGQFLTSWVIMIFIIVYAILGNFLLFSYTSEYQDAYNSKVNDQINQTIEYASNSNIDKDTSTIGFFSALFIVLVDGVPFPLNFFLFALPNILLGVLIYNLIRGNW